jgi:hypothetical protein
MSGIRVGRRVEWKSFNSPVVFRGDLLTMLAGGYYAVVRDHTGLTPRIVRAERLRQQGTLTPAVGSPGAAA